MDRSLIYRHITLYRATMNALYSGGYRRRFERVLRALGPIEDDRRSVVEYCFGDTLLAESWVSQGGLWTGLDLNPYFCERARGLDLQVLEGDLLQLDAPVSDAAIMIGSLYHFHDRLDELFSRVLHQAPRFLLSEPVKNLSSREDLLGRFARRATNPGNGPAPFRFTEETLLEALDKQRMRLGFRYEVLEKDRDLLVDIKL